MKLKKVTVTNYRSVKTEGTLLTDGKITILIGANDHGKSNLLSAILSLNDDSPISEDDRNWDADATDPVTIRWHFTPSADAEAKLNSMVAGGDPSQTFPVNDAGEVVYSREIGSKTPVTVASVPVPVARENEAAVLALRPRVELFQAPSTNFVDKVNKTQLVTAEFEFMQGIFRLAGIWDERETIFAQNERTSRLLDEASQLLTKVLNDTWKQGKDLKWKLEHTGTNGDHIVIQIGDPAIKGRYTRPSARSSGFRSYFLLSMIIYARTQNRASNSYLYLFDEPGTYLHPHAQLDLQRSFEMIADKTQMVYTTHSLFLVNKNYPARNRVISKGKDGTKIDQKPFIRNWKSVRESLGVLLSNNFLIADKTLLVEGPSDVIYLLDAIKKLKQDGQVDIDLNDFSVVDAGDASNYIAMAKLMLSEGRDLVALVDGNGSGRNVEASLKRVCASEIKHKKLTILKLPDGKSSEDVFADLGALRIATRNVFQHLTEDGSRVGREGLDIEVEVATISPEGDRTLGTVIDERTSRWFEPNVKLSKLSIALEYENVRKEAEAMPIPDLALSQVEAIKKALALRGERTPEPGVFEEAD